MLVDHPPLGLGKQLAGPPASGVGAWVGNGVGAGVGGAALQAFMPGAVEMSVEHWPEVRLTDMTAYYLSKGQPVVVPRAPTQGWVRIHENVEGGTRFLGVGEVLDDGRIAPRRLVV